ncbi:MAG: hypothetical protein LWW75_07735 [Chlorobiales bacterium]|nr:hypothetical protein [Chlorobiales bacterium]
MNRCIKDEFKGTAYSPLPDIGALVRVIEEVQRSMVVEHSPVQLLPSDQQYLGGDQVKAAFADFWKRHA